MQLTIRRPHSFAAAFRLGPQSIPATAYAAPVRERARRSDGPEDRALYSCACGYAFKATVTTSVGCPHCGQTQAW